MATLEARLAALITEMGTDFKLGTFAQSFSKGGALTTFTGKGKFQLLGSGIIVAIKGWLETPATGGTTFKVDVNKNGTTIYGTQANRPIWVASANAATVGSHSVTTFADGDQISIDVDAVGSTVAGSDLTVTAYFLRLS